MQHDRLGPALGDGARDLAADAADLALEVPQPGLARVGADDLRRPRRPRSARFSGVRPFSRELLRDQVPLRDLELLLLGVAGELDHLHAVAQRRRDGVEDVRRGDEHDLAEVERHVEVVVLEADVLLRVEHLEQRRRRVAAEVHAELVDLVEHEERVVRARLPQALDDAAGQRADVGAAVAADLGLVADAAEREADELAPHRARDRAPERRLADARRPDEAEDRAPSGPASACGPRGTRGCAP